MDLHRRLEPVAAAHRRDAQVQRRVAGVSALVHDVFRRFLLEPDLDELLAVGVVFAVMSAQSALAFV
jgi:hypothetical protein